MGCDGHVTEKGGHLYLTPYRPSTAWDVKLDGEELVCVCASICIWYTYQFLVIVLIAVKCAIAMHSYLKYHPSLKSSAKHIPTLVSGPN